LINACTRSGAPFLFLVAGLVVGCEQFAAYIPSAVTEPIIGTTATLVDDGGTTVALTAVPFPALPGWSADKQSLALPALLKSCAKVNPDAAEEPFGKQPEMGRVRDWLVICKDATLIRDGNDVEAKYFFESRFRAYSVGTGFQKQGLITGYYEPELDGAWKPGGGYSIPVYSRPRNLVSANLGSFDEKWKGSQISGRLVGNTFVPYHTRAEIESGALAGHELEVLWVADPIDAFFMHIQGSGRIRFADGSHIRLGYAGRNGRRYTPVGRELVAAGQMKLKDVTMPAIRDWMRKNPVGAQALMGKNQSYIFFRVVDTDGPIGAQGVVLTPGRSIAVDRDYYPMGVPIWVVTTDPGVKPAKQLRRLMIAQDTGSAIRGPVRGDFFWGFGAAAGDKAGRMKEKGQIYLLLPRTVLLP
jgi:membrane-bound lytic murein transglycosylase A